MHRVRLAAAILSLSLLTQCGGSVNDASNLQVFGSARGIAWTLLLMQQGNSNIDMQRPGALLGVQAALFIMGNSALRSSTLGVTVSNGILQDTEFEKVESYAILEDLGLLLQVDISDMLNRAESRSRAFNTYVESLENQLQIANNQLSLLEQEYTAKRDEGRDKRRIVSNLERTLREAIRDEDYGSAGNIQKQITDEQSELARIETEATELKDTTNLFDRLIEIGIKRTQAMVANRDALITGVAVTDIPGVEDLGVLLESRGTRGTRDFFQGL